MSLKSTTRKHIQCLLVIADTGLAAEAGGEGPHWFIAVLTYLLELHAGHHNVLLVNRQASDVGEDRQFVF